MAADGARESPDNADAPAPEDVAGGSLSHPLTAAALIGGALAAGARRLSRHPRARPPQRRQRRSSRSSSVMANAITATDVKPH